MKISAVVLLHINLFHLFIFFYHLTTARLHPPYLGISWHNNDPLPLDPRNHRQHCSAMHMINLNWERKVDLICATQLFQIKINLLQLAFAHSMAKFSSKIPNKHVHKANHRSLSEISKSAGTHNLHCTSAAHTSFPVSKAEEKTRIANILWQRGNTSNSLWQNQILIWRALRNIDETDMKSINAALLWTSGGQTRKLISVYYNTGRYRKPTIPAACNQQYTYTYSADERSLQSCCAWNTWAGFRVQT